MQACAKAEKNPLHKKIVDQIVAVDNFMAFKKLMCKRNSELNQQAMKLIVDDGVKKEMTKKQSVEEKKEKPNTEELEKEQDKQVKGKIKDKDMAEALRVA